MTIEEGFDVSFIAGMALREKQIQQNYRPVIGVHKWFARRPGTLFRGLVLAEFGDDALKDCFFQGNDLSGIRIADPFMGGGTPLIEANRVGCDVQGFDVNPMSAWIVREEVEDLDVPAYEAAARALVDTLRSDLGRYYRTTCPHYGDADVPVKSFLWVKGASLRVLRQPVRSVSRLPSRREQETSAQRPRLPVLRRPQRGRRPEGSGELRRVRGGSPPGRAGAKGALRLPALRPFQRLSRERRPPARPSDVRHRIP